MRVIAFIVKIKCKIKDQIDLSKMQSVPVLVPYGFLRLNRYWNEASHEMWDEIWSNTADTTFWKNSLKGGLSEYQKKSF